MNLIGSDSLSTLLFFEWIVKGLHVVHCYSNGIVQEDEVSKYYFQKQLRRVWLMMCFGVWFRRFYWGCRETGTHAVSMAILCKRTGYNKARLR